MSAASWRPKRPEFVCLGAGGFGVDNGHPVIHGNQLNFIESNPVNNNSIIESRRSIRRAEEERRRRRGEEEGEDEEEEELLHLLFLCYGDSSMYGVSLRDT